VPPRFEPSLSPKGFLALYRFAREFARPVAAAPALRPDLQRQLLLQGFAENLPGVPEVVVVPVYWPDPVDDVPRADVEGDVPAFAR
jgi:hypothetical protein